MAPRGGDRGTATPDRSAVLAPDRVVDASDGPVPATTATSPVLRCSGLRKEFGGRVAVDDVSFEIAPGETYGLLGPNGAGKTTTIRMVCGLLRSDRGSVTVAGRTVGRDAIEAKRSIGFVPQDVALYPDLSARENLRFFGRLAGLRRRELDRRTAEVLELVGLADRAGDRVDSFSGGMRRRLNIGAGLIHEPALLVLDEPTVGVDPQSRRAILDSVAALSARGMAVLYTTHYMEEAERICDRMGIIDRGRLVVEGTHRELVAQVAEHDRIELTASGELEGFTTACRELAGIVGASAGVDAAPEQVVNRPPGSRALKAVSYYAPGMGIFFLLFAIGFASRGWFVEQSTGTLERMSALVHPTSILIGKALSVVVYGIASLTTMILVTSLALGADWGGPLPAALLCAGVITAVVCLTAFVTLVSRTQRQAEGIAAMVTFGLALLGGNFTFVSAGPRLMRLLALLTPNGWALRGFTDLATGPHAVSAVVQPLLGIAAFCVVTAGATALLARRQS